MTPFPGYHLRSVPISNEPLVAATEFARGSVSPFVVYERGGQWSCASGALAEIILYRDEIRYREGETWRVAPTREDPLRGVARILASLAIEGWRAYGWAGFELSYLLHGLAHLAGDGPLLHLIVPEREVRLSAGGAVLRAAEESDLSDLARAVSGPRPTPRGVPGPAADRERGGEEYRQVVAAAIADIRAARLRKVILSRVVPVDGDIDMVATYEAGRRGNTPARSFLLDLGGLRAAGFSPETVAEVLADGSVSTQPLAGTRALCGNASADRRLRDVLLGDPKEIYEHAVSVQACQHEMRGVCRDGSLVVDEFMQVVERGSVQHLASRVSGRLAAGRDAWDALAAVFPSITASGVPKTAACAAIARFEREPRGLYSGAVVTVDSDGALDAALALRTVFQRDGHTWLRAGAGIVEQSDPDRELEETREKLRSVSRFLVPAGSRETAAFSETGMIRDLQQLRLTVAELLEEDPGEIGDETNLFELGLESIALMRTVGQWRRAGIEVSFGELAENPTIDGWFTLLSTRVGSTHVGPGPTPAGPVAAQQPDQQPDQDAEFPLALMQHAYWVGRGAGQPLGGVAAHLYTEFDGAEVAPDRLRIAVERLVARHDMLRVRITDNGRQVIEAMSGWRGLSVHDLRGLGDEEATRRLEALRDQLSHQVLDIEHGEVFSTALSLLPGGRTRLHIDVDMVAADAVSYRILLTDLAWLYEHPDEEQPVLGYGYRQYRTARVPARREAARRAAQWWQDRLPGMPGAPDLPRAAGRPASGGQARVSRRHFMLTPAARQALGRAAHSRGVTPAMAVATAFAEVLGGWSAQPRFVLNVPLFDREQAHPDVNQVVGDFTSSVLLEVDLSDSLDFTSRVRRVQARLHADAAHAEYSGVEVLRELTRRTGEQMLAPVVFTSALNLGELFGPAVRRHFGDPVWIISQGPQVLLDAQVTELDGGLLVNWDSRDGAFAPGVVDAMFDAFERLVRGLADGGVTWDIPVDGLVGDSVRDVRRAVGDTAGPRSRRLLHEGFFAHAARGPDAPALLWDAAAIPGRARPRREAADREAADSEADDQEAAGRRGVLSYGELAGRALRVAGALARCGVHPGDLVGVSLPKGPDQVTAVLGVLAAGATYVPIGADQPLARVRRITASAGFTVMIVGSSGGSAHAGHEGHEGHESHEGVVRICLAEALRAAAIEAPVLAAADGPGRLDEPAYVLFTSGSTGQPKGVEVGHRAVMNTIDDLVERLALGADDRTLAVSALDFDLSVFDLFAPLSVGGAVVMVDEESRREARRWAELIRDHRVTVLNCVPTVLDMILDVGTELGDSLRAVLLGGDRVGVDLPGRLAAAAAGCRFLGLGGTTETAIHSTVCEVVGGGPVPAHWRSVPYGTPLRNVRLRVVDIRDRDCPDHVAGELWIGGDGVARGYLGDPDRTADRFVEFAGARWYRTGDLARYLPDGSVEFLGRRDDQVKIRGFRIELGEVEAALAAVPGISAGVAVLISGVPGRGPALGVGVVPGGASQASVEARAIRDRLRTVLPPHMVPDRVVTLERLPLTANGKIDRASVGALLERAAGAPAAARTPPRTDLERVVMKTWQELLAVPGGDAPEFGVSDDFFALGGDSVLATALVARLRQELDTVDVSVRTLFGAPTVAGLAERMRQAETALGRLERVAAIVLEIAALSDDEVAARLDEPDTGRTSAAEPATGVMSVTVADGTGSCAAGLDGTGAGVDRTGAGR